VKVMQALHRIRPVATQLRLWAGGAFSDPIAERLDRERRRDGEMFRRHRAFVPWA
jgi:hypothetical protein